MFFEYGGLITLIVGLVAAGIYLVLFFHHEEQAMKMPRNYDYEKWKKENGW